MVRIISRLVKTYVCFSHNCTKSMLSTCKYTSHKHYHTFTRECQRFRMSASNLQPRKHMHMHTYTHTQTRAHIRSFLTHPVTIRTHSLNIAIAHLYTQYIRREQEEGRKRNMNDTRKKKFVENSRNL